jgi:hypothetical protein
MSVPSEGAADRPIVLTNVDCDGTEMQLGDCRPTPRASIAQCSHLSDAGARCGKGSAIGCMQPCIMS